VPAASKTPADHGDVDLLDRDLRLVRAARGSLAYERALPWDLRLTTEALVTHALGRPCCEPQLGYRFARIHRDA
jgi:hypothetical protein